MPWTNSPRPRPLTGLRRWRAVNRERLFAWSAGAFCLFLLLALWAGLAAWLA